MVFVIDLCAYATDRLSSTRATLVALFCTLSEAFDVPVYWPILVIYFFILFTLTMRRQVQCVYASPSCAHERISTDQLALCRHMIKYKYVPFDIGRKARYGSNSRH